MPSVDPRRLEQEIEQVVAVAKGPVAARDAVQGLFEFYGRRPRHSPEQATLEDLARSYGAPRYVVDQVAGCLRAMPIEADQRHEMINVFWATGYREMRRVSIELLGLEPQATMVAHALQLARDESSGPELNVLAEGVLELLRASDPGTHWDTVARLIANKDGNLRTLGLEALKVASQDPGFEIHPRHFECLKGIGDSSHGRELRAFSGAVRGLADRSPLEVIRFLQEETRHFPLDRHAAELLSQIEGRWERGVGSRQA